MRDRLKFCVGRIFYLTFARDEPMMGFAFPKEEREALVGSEPHKFVMPRPRDMRYHRAVARLAHLDPDEMREIVIDAWQMVTPKKLHALVA